MHTGFVPATIDVRLIQSKWEITLSAEWLHTAATAGDRIFVTTRAPYYGSHVLYALDAATGVTAWSHDFGPIESVNPPAYGNGAVFVQSGGQEDSYLWAFEAGAGGERFHSPFVNQWTHFYAPVVSGSTVYTGGGYGAGVYAYNSSTGTQLWFTELPQTGDYTPAVRNGQVYAHPGASNWGPVALTILDAANGQVEHTISATGTGGLGGFSISTAPALWGNQAFVTSEGRIIAYDLAGNIMDWQKLESFHGQVTVSASTIYVYNGEKVEARRPIDGRLLWAWRPTVGIDQWAQVVATNNLLFVSGNGATYALDLATHLPVWSTPRNGFLSIARDGTLYIAQANGKLAAIALK